VTIFSTLVSVNEADAFEIETEMQKPGTLE